jgi:hypothetical protein
VADARWFSWDLNHVSTGRKYVACYWVQIPRVHLAVARFFCICLKGLLAISLNQLNEVSGDWCVLILLCRGRRYSKMLHFQRDNFLSGIWSRAGCTGIRRHLGCWMLLFLHLISWCEVFNLWILYLWLFLWEFIIIQFDQNIFIVLAFPSFKIKLFFFHRPLLLKWRLLLTSEIWVLMIDIERVFILPCFCKLLIFVLHKWKKRSGRTVFFGGNKSFRDRRCAVICCLHVTS